MKTITILIAALFVGIFSYGVYNGTRNGHFPRSTSGSAGTMTEDIKPLTSPSSGGTVASTEHHVENKPDADAAKVASRKQDVLNSIQGDWVLKLNTGYNKTEGIGTIIEYRFSFSPSSVHVWHGTRDFAIGYGSHDPELKDHGSFPLEELDVQSALDNDEYKLTFDNYSFRCFSVVYENGKFKEIHFYKDSFHNDHYSLKRG